MKVEWRTSIERKLDETKVSEHMREKLKARVCKLILSEGQFDMSSFTGRMLPNGKEGAPRCGTPCCIAGNIVIAMRQLRFKGVKESLSKHSYLSEGVLILGRYGYSLIAPSPHNYLDTYAEGLTWEEVTPQMAVAHVLTGQPLKKLIEQPKVVGSAVRKAKRLIQQYEG